METLIHATCYLIKYAEKHSILIPSEQKLLNLFRHIRNLITEINAEVALPPSVQHLFRTPSDETEPGPLDSSVV